ncbi:MAG: hypothetical protein GDA55_07525 [Cellvibrionales bacterium]|nr:hypothetical protein [Cellvibrionales bacterium]
MLYVIGGFGVLMLAAGALLILQPAVLVNALRQHLDSNGLHFLAVVSRLVLGAILLSYAADSRFPIALQTLGALIFASGVVLGAIGRHNFQRLMAWALGLRPVYQRTAGVLALILGGALVAAIG